MFICIYGKQHENTPRATASDAQVRTMPIFISQAHTSVSHAIALNLTLEMIYSTCREVDLRLEIIPYSAYLSING